MTTYNYKPTTSPMNADSKPPKCGGEYLNTEELSFRDWLAINATEDDIYRFRDWEYGRAGRSVEQARYAYADAMLSARAVK